MPAGLRVRLLRLLPAAVAIWTLGHALVAQDALAQCNNSTNPAPAPPVSANVAGQTFGNTAPLTPYPPLLANGAIGCDGATAGDYDVDGNPGLPGQAGGQVSSTNTSLTIRGGQNFFFGDETAGAVINSSGGHGGSGSEAGAPAFEDTTGGAGGAGGAGGGVNVQFDAVFAADAATGLATIGLTVSSYGGAGGAGGHSGVFGDYIHYGGAGAAGGSGGAVMISASGSVVAVNSGVTAMSFGGAGGQGGDATTTDAVSRDIAGPGGNGGAGGTVTLHWLGGAIQSGGQGLFARSAGGRGGDGGSTNYTNEVSGGDGGQGGAGGTVSVVLAAGGAVAVNVALPGVLPVSVITATANGGDGGTGGVADSVDSASGGSGGAGGNGGAAGIGILGPVTFNALDITGLYSGQAVLVQANGGSGGQGGSASGVTGGSGGGGFAGNGGGATLSLGSTAVAGRIATSGNFAHGALVQSVGGGGGSGGQAGFNSDGGAGAAGGHGGPVEVDAPNAKVVATGRNSIALLAQSVGGGGGAGGDANDIAIGAQIAIGGNGGLGGDGSTVRVNLGPGVFASTSKLGGAGILVQSIGGSGGAGGSATSKGFGFISMAIGGDAGGGGAGGAVNVVSNALVTSYGDHASGLQVQSIGGGGGKGGAAVSFIANALPVASIAIGGGGGGGGPAGDVTAGNTGQLTTYGANATGILVQSIGGGGGSGGIAAARAVDISPNKDIPAVSFSLTMGGKGGAGNTGGIVTLDNAGLIATAGDGAIAVIAQSIGGGGGAGGDSTAASYSGGPQGGVAIALAVSIGGSGGTGGIGGTVTVTNEGLIATRGQDAYGVFAQSVGGGGGAGGSGDASASAKDAKFSFGAAVAVGGTGGTGGHGGTVGVANSGAVTSTGDGADGVFAQSVGGGGGAGGGGVASASGGKLSLGVSVGGAGGAGGNGDTATVANSGSIVTRGTDAIALSVQSIGGGGGKAGKGGATAGGVTNLSNAQALFDILAGGFNIGQTVTDLGDGILQIGQIGENFKATYDELNGLFKQPQADDDPSDDGTSVQINVSVSVGGKGGAAGNGGAAIATNTGAITTYGAQSDAIYAQSVGGGGGSGGAASSTSAASDDTPTQTAIGVGGAGGGGGHGGSVTVTLSGQGSKILTQGVAAFGVFAHSVGGGGGEGSLAGTVSGSLKSLSVGVGGNGGTGGDGGAVTVTNDAGSSLTTLGKHGIGIFAQSVGGGGGVVRTMTTDQTFDPSKIVTNPQGRAADVQGLSLDIGGWNGVAGNGGPVQVITNGLALATGGRDAHGIVAQSIGGGGGFVVGGQLKLPPGGTGGNGGASGNGGTVGVSVQNGGGASTTGDGAFGVIAQSIGGGGGLAGDVSNVQSYQAGTAKAVRANAGDGAAVAVSVNDAIVETTGANAHAIFAQSVGGGGGLVNYSLTDGSATQAQARGTAGGSGQGGTVAVTLVQGSVFAWGRGSSGILAQSDGTSSGAISISIDQTSSVQGGTTDPGFTGPQPVDQRDVAAIRLLGGTSNRIVNAGTITAGTGSPAILTDSPASNTVLTNTGTINGDIVMNNGEGSTVLNQPGGLIAGRIHLSGAGGSGSIGNAGIIRTPSVRLGDGTLTNAGLLDVTGGGAATPTLQGNYHSVAGGVLRVGADFAAGTAHHLAVTGNAVLEPGSVVQVTAANWRRGSVTVLTAEGTLVQDAIVVQPTATTYLFGLTSAQAGSTVTVRTNSRLGQLAGTLNADQRAIAGVLDGLWNSESGLPGTDALATIGSARSYADSLDSIAGRAVAGIVAAKQAASEQFSGSLFSCDASANQPVPHRQDSCGWIRVVGAHTTLAGSGSDPGFRQTTTAYQAGGQKEVAPGWFIGGALGYERNWLVGDGGRAKVSGEVAAAGVMLKHQAGPWLFAGVLEGGYGWYNSRRQVVIGTTSGQANGSPGVAHVGLHLRVEHTTPLAEWYVKPSLTIAAIHRRMSGYSETGSTPFNLRVRASADTIGTASPMVEFGREGRVAGLGALRGFVGLGAAFYVNNDWKSEAGLQSASAGAPLFAVRSPLPSAVGRVSAGLTLFTAAGVEAKLTYDARLAEGYTSQSFVGRLAYPF